MKTRLITFTNLVENLDNEFITNFTNTCNTNGYTYGYIIHDKDEDTKPHYHFVVKALNPLSIKSWSNRFNIAENQVDVVHSEPAMIQYLTHANDDKKHKYEINNIETNNKAYIDKLSTPHQIIEATTAYSLLKSDPSDDTLFYLLNNGYTMQQVKTILQVIFYMRKNN